MLSREFYSKDTVTVARNLLGKKIVRRTRGGKISGIITETEAYRHVDDPASHAFTRITDRNSAMFGNVGTAYVYFTYGMHFCFNVVARHPHTAAGAVLIRATKPDEGIGIMQRNRGLKGIEGLADGPAKMAQAFDITGRHYGTDLTCDSRLYITDGLKRRGKISASPRIGIRKATDKLWNFRMKI